MKTAQELQVIEYTVEVIVTDGPILDGDDEAAGVAFLKAAAEDYLLDQWGEGIAIRVRGPE